MNSINHTLHGLASSLLLNVGFTKLAEKLDPVHLSKRAVAAKAAIGSELCSIPCELAAVGAELCSIPCELNAVGAELCSIPCELAAVGAELCSIPCELGR